MNRFAAKFYLSFMLWGLPFSVVFAQSEAEGLAFNRLNAALNVAISEARTNGGDLVLLDDQKNQIMALRERQQTVMREFRENNNREGQESLFQQIGDLEKELTTEVLLPHQARILNSRVFSKFVRGFQGSVLNTVMIYYKDELGISEAQESKIDILKDDISKQVSEAKEKFRLEMEKINKAAQKGMEDVFTNQQRLQLKKLQGDD